MYGGRDDAYRRLVGYYTDALHAWDGNGRVREAASTLGMSERDYCDHWIARNRGALVWSSGSTGGPPLDHDAAYRDAVIFRAEATTR